MKRMSSFGPYLLITTGTTLILTMAPVIVIRQFVPNISPDGVAPPNAVWMYTLGILAGSFCLAMGLGVLRDEDIRHGS